MMFRQSDKAGAMMFAKCSTCLVKIIVLLCCLPFQLVSAMAEQDLTRSTFTGTAYALNHAESATKVLYTEHHTIYRNAEGDYVKSRVEYKSSEGDVIATKDLRFSEGQTIPELRFDDLRTGSFFETANQVDGKEAHVLLSAKEGKTVDLTKVAIEKRHRTVVDAGFDLFVTRHWDALLEGKRLKLDFLALTRASFYGFYLEQESANEDEIVMSLKPSSFFLGLLMDPIYLRYNKQSKRLLSFEGITNIEMVIDGEAIGQNHLARIEYRYGE